MKEELQSKLVEILTSIQSAAGKASDFALSQLPDIAQSYVAYGRAITSVWILIGILLLYFSYWIVRKLMESDTWEATPLVLIPASAGVMAIAFNINQFILVWFAPKVWLLKELASIVK